ncbi:unnamed protein product [Agarophyton chilense]
MRPRQSIDLGAFHYARARKRRSSVLATSVKSALLPPPIPPLRERTNLLPTTQHVIAKPYHQAPQTRAPTTKCSRTSNSVTKRLRREPLHKHIDLNFSQPQRASKLIEMALLNEFDAKYKHRPKQECIQFELSKNQIMQTMSKFDEECSHPHLQQWKPNPEEHELDNRIAQMEALEQACKEELQAWQRIVGKASEPFEWATLTETEAEHSNDGESDLKSILNKSTQVLETYILQARDILSTASKLKGTNLETHYRVQVIAAALNDKVMSQFRGRPSEVLKPPDTLHVTSTDDEISHRL